MGQSFFEGLAKAFSMILVSEIGDKTFFLAALMAMRHPRRYVIVGSLSALWIMTCLSAFLGWAAPNLLPRQWTHALATLLFFGFGVRSLWDGICMDEGSSRAQEELKEAEAQLDESEKKVAGGEGALEPSLKEKSGKEKKNGEVESSGKGDTTTGNDMAKANGVSSTVVRRPVSGQETPVANGASQKQTQAEAAEVSKQLRLRRSASIAILSPVIFQAFSLIFFGEWGDKSQIATIGLASEENVWGVAVGGCLGHAICNGAAVVGGKHLATRISERMVAFFGGFLFLAFAVHSLLHGPHA